MSKIKNDLKFSETSEVLGMQGNYCEPYIGTVSKNLPQHNDEIRRFWKSLREELGEPV